MPSLLTLASKTVKSVFVAKLDVSISVALFNSFLIA